LFAAPPEVITEQSAVDKALGTIDPDALSPREALDALYKLKKLLNQNNITT
jgi:DNA mismatch repair protein MutS